jgi:prepilin-type N-terminal cleavage/methylation domain-containing protein
VRRRAGFSLTELMVAVAILSVVVAAVMQSFVVQNRAYTVVDQTTEAQQNMRAVAYLLERDIRMSGFMVPEAAAACGVDATNGADTLFVTDADAIDPTDQPRASLGVEVNGYAAALGLRTLVTTTDWILEEPSSPLDNDAFYDLDGDGDADADFRQGLGVILVDADDPSRGVACGTVDTEPAGNAMRVDFLTRLSSNPPNGHRVIAVPAHIYTVAPDPNGGPSTVLMRDGRELAPDVEDLQVAFFFDKDRDGQVDDEFLPNGEMPGGAGADEYDAQLVDNRLLREIRINLVVRTRDADRDNQNGLFQTTENRAAAAVTDGFRRRVHTATVRLRNVGFRGTAL